MAGHFTKDLQIISKNDFHSLSNFDKSGSTALWTAIETHFITLAYNRAHFIHLEVPYIWHFHAENL